MKYYEFIDLEFREKRKKRHKKRDRIWFQVEYNHGYDEELLPVRILNYVQIILLAVIWKKQVKVQTLAVTFICHLHTLYKSFRVKMLEIVCNY